ncbi:MAG: ribosome maturation factor RimM [bacterium]
MNPDDFYYLGKILKKYGSKGHLMVLLDVDEPQDYQNLESVYVDLEHERIPFFIESLEMLEKKRTILKLADVNSADHADAFGGRELYLPLSTLPPLKGNRFYYHEIRGFKVVDAVCGDVGILEDVLELPHQALFQIRSGKKEILVPVVDEVVREVDRINKTLYIQAPEGLIEVYL